MLTALFLGVVGIGVLLSFFVSDAGRGARPAPPVEVLLFDGTAFSLAGHLAEDGRPVVLNLWASWCIPCRTEMPAFGRVAGQTDDVLFLGIAVEDQEQAARAFAAEIGVGYPLAWDQGGEVAAAYASVGLPTTYFVDRDGDIVRQAVGEIDAETLHSILADEFGVRVGN